MLLKGSESYFERIIHVAELGVDCTLVYTVETDSCASTVTNVGIFDRLFKQCSNWNIKQGISESLRE